MEKTFTDEDVVSTAEVQRECVKRGVNSPFGATQLSPRLLMDKGFRPTFILRNTGYFWPRAIVDQIVEKHQPKPAVRKIQRTQKSQDVDNEEIFNAIEANFSSLGRDVLTLKKKMDAILKAFEINVFD